MSYRIIKSLEQYNEYNNIHEKLLREDEVKNEDELRLIELLVDDYEQNNGSAVKRSNPVELLKGLLIEGGISNTQLATELDVSKQLITEILAYRKNISKKMVRKLAAHFALREEAFSAEYELLNVKATA
ncbi:helix-turn-helix domain-containing protein [Chitinophagales bacterium]|nr:helix-turn-helix domain-containing protein [Chitinophagales bacterium]